MEVDFFGVKKRVAVKRASLGEIGLGEWIQRREEVESVAMTVGWLVGLVVGLEAWVLCGFCLLSDKRQERRREPLDSWGGLITS